MCTWASCIERDPHHDARWHPTDGPRKFPLYGDTPTRAQGPRSPPSTNPRKTPTSVARQQEPAFLNLLPSGFWSRPLAVKASEALPSLDGRRAPSRLPHRLCQTCLAGLPCPRLLTWPSLSALMAEVGSATTQLFCRIGVTRRPGKIWHDVDLDLTVCPSQKGRLGIRYQAVVLHHSLRIL